MRTLNKDEEKLNGLGNWIRSDKRQFGYFKLAGKHFPSSGVQSVLLWGLLFIIRYDFSVYFCLFRSYKSGSGVNNRRTELFLKEHEHLRRSVCIQVQAEASLL